MSPRSRRGIGCLPNGQPLAISDSGHYWADADVCEHIRYVVQTAAGQETLTPAELESKYGWKNDPTQVKLLAE